MMKIAHKFVKNIPDAIEPNTLYVSVEYATAIHKCFCGCGNEVVTPLSPTDWKLAYDGKCVSLYPSIGNWSLPCQSRIRELAVFVKNFTYGQRFLRRFYYGADYGQKEASTTLTEWSKHMLRTADTNGFEVIDKRVKYIHSADSVHGFEKKCDLDVEMTVDLIRERDNYDTIVLFSGDGDLVTALRYLREEYGKSAIVVGARGHVGREVVDAHRAGVIEEILYADDLEYRLNMDRFRNR